MDTTVTTKTLSHPDYILHVIQQENNLSYVGTIVFRQPVEEGLLSSPISLVHEQQAQPGETVFMSFPQATAEAAEKAAYEYYIQLNKPKEI